MYNKHPTWLSEKSIFDLKFVKIKKFFFQKKPGYATAQKERFFQNFQKIFSPK